MNEKIREKCKEYEKKKSYRDFDSNLKDFHIYCAGMYGDLDIIKEMMLEGSYNVHYGFYGACRGGSLEIVKLLISPSVDFVDGIKSACIYGHIEIINFLFSEETLHNNLNYYYEVGIKEFLNYGMRNSCYGRQIEVLKLLIDKGADDFNSSMHYDSPCETDDYELCSKIVEILINHGATDRPISLKLITIINRKNFMNIMKFDLIDDIKSVIYKFLKIIWRCCESVEDVVKVLKNF